MPTSILVFVTCATTTKMMTTLSTLPNTISLPQAALHCPTNNQDDAHCNFFIPLDAEPPANLLPPAEMPAPHN